MEKVDAAEGEVSAREFRVPLFFLPPFLLLRVRFRMRWLTCNCVVLQPPKAAQAN